MSIDKSDHWLLTANYDLETAKIMYKTKRWLYVIFMCHQTIEKSLKAVIAKGGIFPPKTHNLNKLLELAQLNHILSKEQHDFIEEIDPFNIITRYPEDINELLSTLSKNKCNEILNKTEDFLKWIENKLKPTPPSLRMKS